MQHKVAHDIGITESWVTSSKVIKLFRHPGFNTNTAANDIAIIKLEVRQLLFTIRCLILIV